MTSEISSNEPVKLNWSDLQTDVSNVEIVNAYRDWPGIEKFNEIKPLFVSAFGDLFFVGDDKLVYQVDIVELVLKCLNIKEEEFKMYINNESTINEVLMSWLIYKLKENKKLRNANQVYCFSPHPIWGGKIEENNVMIMDLKLWINLCVQMTK